MKNPEYLGDGVYAHQDSHTNDLILTTAHHDPALAHNVIVFDRDVLKNLIKYLENMHAKN